MAASPARFPFGVVGRITGGRYDGFYIEVDDDTRRPSGTGGYYILYWNGSQGYDNWTDKAENIPAFLEGLDIEWLSPEESDGVPGSHSHGPSDPA